MGIGKNKFRQKKTSVGTKASPPKAVVSGRTEEGR